MISIEEKNEGFMATFPRTDYSIMRGTGATRTEALINLRAEIETALIHDEKLVSRQVEAIDEIDGLLG